LKELFYNFVLLLIIINYIKILAIIILILIIINLIWIIILIMQDFINIKYVLSNIINFSIKIFQKQNFFKTVNHLFIVCLK